MRITIEFPNNRRIVLEWEDVLIGFLLVATFLSVLLLTLARVLALCG